VLRDSYAYFLRAGRVVSPRAGHKMMKLRQVDVLIVEDQQADVELLLRALLMQASHITSAVATTGTEGIEYLQTHSPKAILLDLHLPDMDGCDFLKQIREDRRYRSVPVIVITDFATDRQRREVNGLGISGYIKKTSDLHALSDHLLLFKHLIQNNGAR
jgi:two-component system, response regulator